MNRKHRYYAFLLRLWQEGQNDGVVWRASLEEPGTGRVWGFDGLDVLAEHLRHLLDSPDGPHDSRPTLPSDPDGETDTVT